MHDTLQDVATCILRELEMDTRNCSFKTIIDWEGWYGHGKSRTNVKVKRMSFIFQYWKNPMCIDIDIMCIFESHLKEIGSLKPSMGDEFFLPFGKLWYLEMT